MEKSILLKTKVSASSKAKQEQQTQIEKEDKKDSFAVTHPKKISPRVQFKVSLPIKLYEDYAKNKQKNKEMSRQEKYMNKKLSENITNLRVYKNTNREQKQDVHENRRQKNENHTKPREDYRRKDFRDDKRESRYRRKPDDCEVQITSSPNNPPHKPFTIPENSVVALFNKIMEQLKTNGEKHQAANLKQCKIIQNDVTATYDAIKNDLKEITEITRTHSDMLKDVVGFIRTVTESKQNTTEECKTPPDVLARAEQFSQQNKAELLRKAGAEKPGNKRKRPAEHSQMGETADNQRVLRPRPYQQTAENVTTFVVPEAPARQTETPRGEPATITSNQRVLRPRPYQQITDNATTFAVPEVPVRQTETPRKAAKVRDRRASIALGAVGQATASFYPSLPVPATAHVHAAPQPAPYNLMAHQQQAPASAARVPVRRFSTCSQPAESNYPTLPVPATPQPAPAHVHAAQPSPFNLIAHLNQQKTPASAARVPVRRFSTCSQPAESNYAIGESEYNENERRKRLRVDQLAFQQIPRNCGNMTNDIENIANLNYNAMVYGQQAEIVNQIREFITRSSAFEAALGSMEASKTGAFSNN